jgi:hypothetical protein
LIDCAAVDKIEDKRKPEDFIGHRKQGRHAMQKTDRSPETLSKGFRGFLFLIARDKNGSLSSGKFLAAIY